MNPPTYTPTAPSPSLSEALATPAITVSKGELGFIAAVAGGAALFFTGKVSASRCRHCPTRMDIAVPVICVATAGASLGIVMCKRVLERAWARLWK